jgi:hypothetical protein
MAAIRKLWAVIVIVLSLCITLAAIGEQGDARPGAGAQATEGTVAPADASKGGIPMVRFVLRDAVQEGRLVSEDEGTLRVESLSGSVIGYRKADFKNLERFSLSPEAYYERVGDYFADQLWDFKDDLNDFARARRAYQKSLNAAPTESAKEKLEELASQREVWQKEMLLRQEILAAEARAESARLEKEATQRKLKDLQDIADGLGTLEERVKAMEQSEKLTQARLQDIRHEIRNLQDDVYRRFDRVYVVIRRIETPPTSGDSR